MPAAAFSQTFPAVNFNPSIAAQSGCSNITGVDESTRPFTDVTPNSDGSCSVLPAQGNGQQAGVGGMNEFEASFVGSITVASGGDLTFDMLSDDGWVLGMAAVGGVQPSYLTGALVNAPATTPVRGYQVVGAENLSPAVSGNAVTVRFLGAGTYPIELDYTECCSGPLALTMTVGPWSSAGPSSGTGPLAPSPIRQGADLWGSGGNRGSSAARSCAQGDPINCDTGNLFETVADLAVGGRGPAISLARTYNAFDAGSASASHRFGYGWTDSYSASLTLDTAVSPAQAIVHSEDGSTVRFKASGGAYVPVGPWVIASLIANADGTYTYLLPDQTVYRFGPSGALTSERDRDGNTTSLAYNAAGQLITVTDAAGRVMTFTPRADGLVTAATDPMGRVVAYGYDGAQNLISVTDPTGSVTRYTYDGAHRMVTAQQPTGGTTTNTFDASNRVVLQSDPLGRVTALSYVGNTTRVTDPVGNVTLQTYQNHLLTAITRGVGTPQAATSTFAYNDADEEISAVDPRSSHQSHSYDGTGNLLSSTDGLGHTTRYAYSALNDLVSMTDPMGRVTTVNRDATGHVLSVVRTHTEDGQIARTSYSHGDATHSGDVTAVTDADSRTTSLSYDAVGNLVQSIDPMGYRTTLGYNAIGWRTSQTAPLGNVVGGDPAQHTSSWTFNGAGDMLSSTDAAGDQTIWTYDANHNRVSQRDPNGHVTSYVHDSANQQTEVDRADGTSTKTAYDGDGRVAIQTDGVGHRTMSYGYDPLGRLASQTDALNRATTFGYDGSGNQVSVLDSMGRTTSMSYDAANRLTALVYSGTDTPHVAYTYDADGRRLTMADGLGVNQYSYDSLGRLVQSSGGGGGSVVSYTYDLAGQMTSLASPDQVIRAYDAAGHVTSITDWLGNTTSFVYDADGNVTGTTYPGGVSTSMTYDRADRLARSTTTGPRGVIMDLPYTRDGLEQLTSSNALGTSPGVTQSYSYDPVNRLTGAAAQVATTSVPSNGYTYDAADRLTAATTAGVLTSTLGYDTADEVTSSTSVPGGQTSFTYDGAGNRTTSTDPLGNRTNYTYDVANRLARYAGPAFNAAQSAVQGVTNAQISVRYSYDGDGLRWGKGASSAVPILFTWDLAEGMPVLLGDYPMKYVTDPSGLPLEQVQPGGTVLYYHHDQLGSTRELTDSQGNVAAAYAYDPYGNALGTVPSVVNPFRFAGQYQDVETGLYYMRARYYDPATAQFLSRDPMVMVTRSAYGYVAGNPLNRSDPSGLLDLPFGLCARNPFGGDNDNGGCHTIFSDRQAAGLSLGVIAAGTGAGALFAGSTGLAVGLGGASFVSGLGASGVDAGPCREGDSSACVGLALGAGGVLGGGFGVGALALGASRAVAEAFEISGLTLGLAGTTWDLFGSLYSHSPACGP